MTERDAIREVVEKSITLTTEIEPLRVWCKTKYAEAVSCGNVGRADSYRDMIKKLDELEAKS